MWKNARARSDRYAVNASSPSSSGPQLIDAMLSANDPTASKKLSSEEPMEAVTVTASQPTSGGRGAQDRPRDERRVVPRRHVPAVVQPHVASLGDRPPGALGLARQEQPVLLAP